MPLLTALAASVACVPRFLTASKNPEPICKWSPSGPMSDKTNQVELSAQQTSVEQSQSDGTNPVEQEWSASS